VFEQGTPSRKLYRKFNIQTVAGQDDFASMEEVLLRRLRRWQTAQQEAARPGGKLDPAFGLLPDLLIVDGGKGQLGRAVQVLDGFGLTPSLSIAGLAKGHEEIYLPGRPDPVILPRRSDALFLVQRIRDEAHRVALTQHRTQRRNSTLVSKLDGIPGIGPARRKALLRAFGDLDRIREASTEELTAVRGITRELADRLKGEL
jgi:excinuclease ABC subunit C